MIDYADNLKWLQSFLSSGRLIYKTHVQITPHDPRYHARYDAGWFIGANVADHMRLYLYETEEQRDREIKLSREREGWPAEYEHGQGVVSPASGKVDYAKITKEIVGR